MALKQLWDQYWEADRARNRGDQPAAIAVFDTLLDRLARGDYEVTPADAEAHPWKDPDKQLLDLRHRSHVQRGLARRALTRTDASQTAALDAAIADFSAALDPEPIIIAAWFFRGCAHIARGSFDAGFADIRAFARRAKSEHDLRRYSIMVASINADLNGALDDLALCFNAEPIDAAAYFARGVVSHATKRSQLAIADYERALQADPRNLDFAKFRQLFQVQRAADNRRKEADKHRVYPNQRDRMQPDIDYAYVYSEFHGLRRDLYLSVRVERFNVDGALPGEWGGVDVPKAEEAAMRDRLLHDGFALISQFSHKEGQVYFYQRPRRSAAPPPVSRPATLDQPAHVTAVDRGSLRSGIDYAAVASFYASADPNVYSSVVVTHYGLERDTDSQASQNVPLPDEARIHADLIARGYRRVSSSSTNEATTMYYQRGDLAPAQVAGVDTCVIATMINHATKRFNSVTIRYTDAFGERQQTHYGVSPENERRFRDNLAALGWQFIEKRLRIDGADYRYQRPRPA